MTTTIVLPQLSTLRSQAVKYIIEKIGINIRPDEPYYNIDEDLWYVPCKAVIPNHVTNREEEGKTFLYKFNNICNLEYKHTKEGYTLVNPPSINEIETTLSKKLMDLTLNVEKELLKCGKNSWGKLTLVKQYLSPLYSMLAYLVDEGELPFSLLSNKKYDKYKKLLLHAKYMKIDTSREESFVESNFLIKMKENRFENNISSSKLFFIETIVGNIYAEYYDIIKYDMGINSPSSYVDTTKIYYFNALKYGENIRFTESDFIKHFIFYGNFLESPRDLNFKNSLLELTEYQLLNKTKQYYFGTNDIYEHLYEYKENLIHGGNEYY